MNALFNPKKRYGETSKEKEKKPEGKPVAPPNFSFEDNFRLPRFEQQNDEQRMELQNPKAYQMNTQEKLNQMLKT